MSNLPLLIFLTVIYLAIAFHVSAIVYAELTKNHLHNRPPFLLWAWTVVVALFWPLSLVVLLLGVIGELIGEYWLNRMREIRGR